MRVCVLTTSYPRDASDVAGLFVADAVRGAREAGADVRVVSPQDFPGFGIPYGGGIVQNLRREPWRVALVPAFFAAFARAARRASRGCDLVHAHWLPSALAARATGLPYVVQVWGSDLALARRVPRLARVLLGGATAVVAASDFLAAEAEALGARRVRLVPSGVDLPPAPAEPEEPPFVLYAGRLSPEKGILEFVEATDGLPRRIVGDGPLRPQVPDALGFVAPGEMGAWYDRAAVVCVPSRREGYGMTAREAMAHGRPVVASAVGGLADAIEDGETGVLVPPGDVTALREALERLLGDAPSRVRLGAAAREAAAERFSRAAETEALLAVWRETVAAASTVRPT